MRVAVQDAQIEDKHHHHEGHETKPHPEHSLLQCARESPDGIAYEKARPMRG
jgi:hypothetical protein